MTLLGNWIVRPCAVISGVILLRSMLKIRAFYKKNQAQDQVDTGSLLRHGVAFVLYLVASALLLPARLLYDYNVDYLYVYQWTLMADTIAQFISQVLLIIIFWNLGKKRSESRPIPASQPINLERPETEEESAISVEVETVEDVDLDLDARIWNGFKRIDHGIDSIAESGHSFMITGSELKEPPAQVSCNESVISFAQTRTASASENLRSL